jgi:isopenicillin N synthase-like dioxygenase
MTTDSIVSSIPVIDIAALHDGSPRAQQAVADQIAVACRETGFFYVVGHGVPTELTDALFREAQRFFDLPLESKLAVHHARSGCGRGYEPLGVQTLEAGMQPDQKESFLIGDDVPDDGRPRTAYVYGGGRNIWPDGLPGWRETMERYAAVMRALSCTMMRGMALSLGLEPSQFAAYCEDPATMLRLLHYPAQPANARPDELGCGAHTDWGGLTFLLQDDAGGLQVRAGDGWIDATPLPGSFVVNIGDMLARWTNDRYRSTLHRVINRSGRRRFSIAFFFEGAIDHEVACLPSCLERGELPRYPPTTVGRHLTEMYLRSYGTSP